MVTCEMQHLDLPLTTPLDIFKVTRVPEGLRGYLSSRDYSHLQIFSTFSKLVDTYRYNRKSCN